MLTIYRKQIKKNWIFWLAPSVLMAAMALLMVVIWPEFESYMIDLKDMMDLPIYQALISGGSISLGMDTFEGFLSMEMFIISDIVYLAIALLAGTVFIAREVDTGTLDMMLSLPLPRWKLLLEKFAAFATVMLSLPVLMWITTFLSTAALGIEFNSVAFFLAVFGRMILYITLTSVVTLCSVIFMDTSRTLGSAGLILGGSFIFESLGGLIRTASVEIADILQGVSLFHYLEGGDILYSIIEGNGFPLEELALVVVIGVMALLASLVIFQKREFK